MRRGQIAVLLGTLVLTFASGVVSAQPLQKTAVQVDPGNTKEVGATFAYRLTYSCNNTSGDCIGAWIADTVPPELEVLGTVPAAPSGDVASISIVGNMVSFTMVSPLTAGNSGDLLINVRFPNGTTPNGTEATNTADGTNLETSPGTFTTPPVDVTAVATNHTELSKVVTSGTVNLDMPESYRLRVRVPTTDGTLQLTSVGPVVDTLPLGDIDSLPPVFLGATPAAACEPGCVSTRPPTLTWPSPCTVPLNPGQNCNITVNVQYPSSSFTSGVNVTNSFTADGTPLGEPSGGLGTGQVTHPVVVFTPNPNSFLNKRIVGPNPPALNQSYGYTLDPRNNGNVDLVNFVIIDTLPTEFQAVNVSTGAYNNPPATVTVDYETNFAAFALLGSSPGGTNLVMPIPALAPGEYVTRLRWTFSDAPAGMLPSSSNNRPRINGTVIDPANDGSPVGIGTNVNNCSDLTADYPAPGTPITPRNDCESFNLSGPFVQFDPRKDNQSGAGPFAPGQTINWRLRVRTHANSNDPTPLESLAVVDLLPVDLVYSAASWTFSDNGTGLPAPQNFEEIANYGGSGQTLLRWTWNAGSGSLSAAGQEVRIFFDTTVRQGAVFGPLSNTMGMTENDPGLAQRCGSSSTDILDLDGDTDTGDVLCVNSGSAEIAPIAQMVSLKEVEGLCDGGFGTSSSGTLHGGAMNYRLTVQNVGTVPMEDFVIVDILPHIGDTGVLDLTPRSSLWNPLLIAPITPPAGTVVYYSTSGNPCRGEVGGPTGGCDAPNWSTVPPIPITDTQSFKVEFGDRVLGAFDSLQFEFQMTAPADAPTGGLETFNSFAYLGERSDGLGSLNAEPNKRGVTIGSCPASSLGDYVWVDTDGDGTQNDGNTGLNGVYVELFAPGFDGLPGTFDDVLLSSTVTSDDGSGNPGWYAFPGLAGGSYQVCFEPPPTYAITVADAGGDDALDSDVNPATQCAPLTVLGLPEDNPTLDLGLLPPEPAALGNYVWFDRNADGDQNESPFDGANGVTVRLYVDDGDGVQEPGGDDVQVASTATADDVYGNPGYYLFDGLTPGVPYYVEVVLPAAATGFTSQDSGANDTVDSDVDLATGVTQIVTLGPGEYNPTLDAGLIIPTGIVSLGNQVWFETVDNAIYEPEIADLGIDGVELSLYLDASGDGQPTVDEYVGSTVTSTLAGFPGRYLFDQLDNENYIVVVDIANFAGSGALAGWSTCTANDPAPDPDDDLNGDDNGKNLSAVLGADPVSLASGTEPITDGDSDTNSNLSVDFCFTPTPVGPIPEYDYGDNPDVLAGPSPGDYQTTALDMGAYHQLLGPLGPYLGDCVDADNGLNQNTGANADDINSFGSVFGVCALPGDDEDGVVFTNPFIPGQAAPIEVRSASGSPCTVNAWIDWNHNGVFDPVEQIITDSPVSGLPSSFNPIVPPGTLPGLTYARFRCSTAGGDGPIGLSPNGEVEDYLVAIQGEDLGDAPDSFATTLGVNGPVHSVNPVGALRLGDCVDTDLDGQPSGGADGDDINVGTSTIGLCIDDEDGVTFDTMLFACQTGQITVTANGPARLDAFIDFSGDGTFSQAGEQVFTSNPLVAGANVLPLAVPCTAVAGISYARFRLSTAGGLSFDGPATDGEVEDYTVLIKGNDWGDAPASYAVTQSNGGGLHGVDPAAPIFLGSCVDTEADGQVSAGADGDDLNAGTPFGTCTGSDDEDGVVFTSVINTCNATTLSVMASQAGLLDAWMDFDINGNWNGVGERIFASQPLAAGVNNLAFTTPCSALPGPTYLRFRYSTVGIGTPGGGVMDGEVEDYLVTTLALDMGDAPDSYATTFGAGGPTHEFTSASSLYLGACEDGDADGQPTVGADGDNLGVGGPTLGICATGNDDEDGVTFVTGLTACKSMQIDVVANASGLLDGWIDYDADGSFAQAGDQVFTNQAVTAGVNSLSVVVPCSASEGSTYSRFRLSSVGGLSFDGPSPDGEVEDYLIVTRGADLGDAPDSYGTTEGAGGPLHGVDGATSLYFGSCVDVEDDGQPAAVFGNPADLDDSTAGSSVVGTCSGIDDEDGINFVNGVTACQVSTVDVTVGADGVMDAWVDFGGDGTFDPTDRVFTGVAVTTGTNPHFFTTPCSATTGITYARFRLSSAGVSGPGGPAPDGEIEDYDLSIRPVDLGDAPNSYGTLEANGGPHHGIFSGYSLGTLEDSEADGQPSVGADGDDLGGVDDEDGVTFPGGMAMASACDNTSVDVELVNSARLPTAILDAWIDFDGDGTFNDPRDRIATGVILAPGTNTVNYTVPCDASSADSYARFRLSSSGVAGPGGPAADGEIEDYAFRVKGLDFGDAPDPTYPVLLASNGARHSVLPQNNPTLGVLVDTEPDGQPSPNHSGDDNQGVDDEDGIVFPTILIPGTDGTVEISTGATGGLVSVWVDFDQNGVWSPAEQIVTDLAVAASDTVTVSFPVPVGSPMGTACVRARISSDSGLPVDGPASDGEVEDHIVAVGEEDPAIGVAKQVTDVVDELDGNFLVTFEIRIANFGNVPLFNVNAVDDLATTFEDAGSFAVVTNTSLDFSVNPAYDGDLDIVLLAPGNTLAVGQSGLIVLEVRVDPAGNPGPYYNLAVGEGTSPEDEDVSDDSHDGDDPDPNGDGDPGNDTKETEVRFPISVIEIPTLDFLGLLLLAMILAGFSVGVLKR